MTEIYVLKYISNIIKKTLTIKKNGSFCHIYFVTHRKKFCKIGHARIQKVFMTKALLRLYATWKFYVCFHMRMSFTADYEHRIYFLLLQTHLKEKDKSF